MDFNILAIDPGISTGYALINDGRDDSIFCCDQAGTLRPEDICESILVGYSKRLDLHVVIEDIPIPTMSKMNLQLREVLSELDSLFPDAVKIKPSAWKSNEFVMSRTIALNPEIEGSQHILDALHIGIFYAVFRMKK